MFFLHYTALIKSFLVLCFFTYTTTSLAADVTEDFSTSTLKDAVKTSANWSTSSENVTFPWLTQQAGVTASFATGSDINAATNDTRSIVTADINGDGYLDVITGDYNQPNKLYLNDGTGNFSAGVDITTDTNATISLVVADIDGDGDLDVLTGNFNQATRLYKNDGTGNFAAGVNISSDTNLTKSLTVADIDGDGDLDVLEGNDGTNRLYLNDGTGNFAAGVDISTDAHKTESLTTADVNGDGDLDVLAGNINSQTNRLYLNDGAGNFSVGVDITSDSDETYSLIATDIDNDGDIDILAGNYNRANRLYRNDGSGNFTTGVNISSDVRRTASLTLVDIDGDGDLDVLEGNSFDTSNRLYLNNGSGNFTVGVDITTDANDTRSIIAADIDGDGDLDVLTGNYGQINRVYLNNNSDLFAPGANISADTNNSALLITADIDGDGDIDVLAGNNNQTNKVYLNNGDGTFAAGTEISADTHATISLTTADIDGDGDLDLLEGNYGQTSWIYLNNGDGTFATGTEISAYVKRTFGLTTIDIDSDGDLDVITGNQNSPNLVYLNNGDGTFTSGTDISAGVFNTYNTYNTNDLTTADIDGDGDFDLLAGNWDQVNRVYLNNGDGTFATGTDISADIHYTFSLTTADIDGDGDIDVLAGNKDQTNRVYLNNGDGTFAAGTNISADVKSTVSLTTTDIDGDGDLDVLAGNRGQTNQVYLNNGDGTFAAGQNISEDTLDTSSVTTADIDGDGDLDVLTGNSNQTNRVYLNNSGGNFVVGMNIIANSNLTHSITTADIDGDGDLDVITAEDSSPNRLYLNDGNGNLAASIDITADAVTTLSITTADIDGDGDLDVLAGNYIQANRLYLNEGDGNFAAGIDISTDTQTTTSITTADIDGDGDLDVLVGNINQSNRLYLNDGNGNFAAGINITTDAHSTYSLTTADIDDDGDLDVLVGNTNSTVNRLYRNDGTGNFPAGEDITSDSHYSYSLTTVDIDGDGDLDVLVGNYNGSNRLYRNDGAGNFATGEDITSDSQATLGLITADIDGDGDLDVLVVNQNQTNRLYLNDGDGNFAAGIDISTDAYKSESLNVADMDGDGDLDLVVGNYDNYSQIYLMGRYALNESVASSTNVNSSGLDIAGLTFSATQTANTASTRNTDIDYYVTNNGGSRWHKVTTGQVLNFPDRGNSDVRWKATLSSASEKVSPALSEVALTFVTATNTTPVISGTPATTIAEDSAYSFTPSVTDPDSGDTKTFSITNKPSWATFNTSTGALTGTPSQAHIGTTTGIVISVKDTENATDSLANFNITVYTTNTTPVISGTPATTVAEDSVYSFTPTVTDPDSGDSKTFSITNKPSWATFSTTTGTLAGIPLQAHIGTTSGIVISVKDAENATDSLASFNITVVNTNDAPVISGSPATSVAEDSAYSFTPTVTDPDSGDSKIFSITNKPDWATFSTTTGVLTGTPTNDNVGTTSGIVISVRDTALATASLASFNITVSNTNDAPVISGSPLTSVAESSAYSFTPTVTDPDTGDSKTFSITNKPDWATFSTTTGALTGTPTNANVGTTSGIVISVRDTALATASLASFNITVSNTNDAPVISGSPLTSVAEDSAYSFTPTVTDSDIGDSKTFIITNKPDWATFSTTTGALTGTPTNANVGTTSGIVISVRDTALATASLASFNITVSNTNDAPVISGTPATSVAEDSPYSFTPTVTDPDTADSQIFSIINKPSWAAFSTATGTLSGTPSRTDGGDYAGIIISVKDRRNASASLPSFVITVLNTNEIPIANDQTLTLDEDSQLTIMLSATDTNDDELTYAIVTESTHGTLVQATENKWIYTPEENYNGTDSFTYKAMDDEADSESAVVELTINSINDAPTAQDDGIELTYSEDGRYILDVLNNDSDVDGDTLTLINASSAIGSVNIEDGQLVYQLQGVIEDEIALRYVINDGHSSQNNGNSEAIITVNFDDSADTLLPIINLPNDININATALFTKVDLGVATAINSKNESIPASLVDSITWFTPGNNLVFWQAQDSDGFKRIATQRVTINPLINLSKDRMGSEGEHYKVAVYLNGESPSYPMTVYYNVTGDADSADHDLVSGELVIDSGLVGYIEFETFDDGVEEADETVIITLDTSMNVGAKSQFTLTITEHNIAPQVSVSISQNNQQRTLIDKNLGEVVISSEVFDSNSADRHSYTWASVSGELLDTDADDTSFTFDPANLAVGQQIVSLTITDDGDTPLETKVFAYLDIVGALSPLTDIDSDGDLIPDSDEGYGDSDGDGIANYLDNNSDCHVQPVDVSEGNLYLIKTESSTCLHRGVNKTRYNFSSLLLSADDVTPDDEVINVGGIFDFVISELPVAGQSVSVVLPQHLPVPENALYRKLITDLGWTEFILDSNNYYSSAPGEKGYCPAPNDNSWTMGLTAGHWCVQVTIEDGGPNDEDGLANNQIVDPGGVAIWDNNNALPTIVSEQVITTQNKPLTLDVLANDSGSDNLIITSANADFGSVSIVDQQLFYQPDTHFFGSAFITYGVNDGDNGSGSGEVSVNVIENTAPVTVNDSATTDDRTAITIEVLANDTDVDNDDLSLINATAEQGSITINDNILTYTPLAGFVGVDMVTYEISDNNGGASQGQVTITITKKSSGGSLGIFFILIPTALLFIRRRRDSVNQKTAIRKTFAQCLSLMALLNLNSG